MSDWVLISVLAVIALSAIVFFIYPLKANKKFMGVVSLSLLALIASAYFYWGGFAQWHNYQQAQESQKLAKQMMRSIKTPKELIAKLKAQLNDSPKSAKGWYLLGRLYMTQNDFEQAVVAFAKAHHFVPENEQYMVNYAHSLWSLNNRQFNKQIRSLFNELLRQNPNQPDALAMLAMNSFLNNEYEQAINYWQRLLKQASPKSQEALAIHKAIAKAQEQINKKREEKND